MGWKGPAPGLPVLSSCPQLIQFKADINAVNEHGNTPLHYACFWGHDQVAEVSSSTWTQAGRGPGQGRGMGRERRGEGGVWVHGQRLRRGQRQQGLIFSSLRT